MNRQHFLAVVITLSSAIGCNNRSTEAVLPKLSEPPKPKVTATPPDVRYVEITKEAGINFVHTSGAAGEKLLPETMGSGVAFLDIDGDGDQDLFLVNSNHWPNKAPAGKPAPTMALYRNDGTGKFTNITIESGLVDAHFGMGVAVGDYDNDGDQDIYLTSLGGGYLYQNDGKGHFTDVTTGANAAGGDGWLTSAAFFDMENDGDLDLYICRYVAWTVDFDRAQGFQLAGNPNDRAYGPPTAFGGSLNTLLRNDGGTFVDVSESSGIHVRTPDLKSPVGKSMAVAPLDVDGDGLVDLAVANDTVPNFFFHNLGGGKFEEVGYSAGIAFDQSGSARGAMGIDWGDFKNDGSLGLAIGNFANEMTALYVTDDPKRMKFADLANIFGLGAATQPPLKFGLFFLDYDLDGRLDLLSVNGHLESDIAKVQASETYAQSAQLFWNSGQIGRNLYTLVPSAIVGTDLYTPIVGRGSAYADIDGDGDLDLVFTANGGPARLFRNEGTTNHWIRLDLRGQTVNRDAIGAKVELVVADKSQRRQLFTTKGYLSAVEHPLTFGLGTATKADRITIVWPGGKTLELKDIDAGKLYVIDEVDGLRQ